MNQYFQRELDYLRQSGRAFAKANPSAAPHLGELSADPDVERLLEGFAFLTAQIQEQSAAWVPELAQDLLHVLAPQMQCVVPSQSVVAFAVDRRRLRSTQVIDCGTALEITSPKNSTCRFRTMEPCVLGCIDKLTMRLEQLGAQSHTLRIDADIFGMQGASSLASTQSRVFISGNYADASNLLVAIVQHTKRLRLRVDEQEFNLDPKQHLRYAPSIASRPSSQREQFSPQATTRMRQYLSLPEASLFFDIVWPDHVLEHTDADKVSLEISLEQAHGLKTSMPDDALQLHCVVAVNLFEASAIPLRQSALFGPQLVRAEPVSNGQIQIYDIEAVEGICDTSFERVRYQSYRNCSLHAGKSDAPYYHVQTRPSANSAAHDTYLSVHTPEDTLPDLRPQTLSVSLTCTNGSAPIGICAQTPCRLLKPGALQTAMTVCAASAPLQAASVNCDSWILLGYMSSLRPGSNIRFHLQQLLSALSSAFDAHSSLGRAHAQRIEGIVKLESKPGFQLYRGIATACETLTMHLNSEAFTSFGDAFIFSGIIDGMLADARGINHPHKLRVVMMPSEQTYEWPSHTLDGLRPHQAS